MMKFVRWLLSLSGPEVLNRDCECPIYCGAYVKINGYSIWSNPCKTVMARTMARFREYPWNQIGVNGQTLTTNDTGNNWVLKDRDGNAIDRERSS